MKNSLEKESTTSFLADVTDTNGNTCRVNISRLKILGRGRAAVAMLCKVDGLEENQSKQVVEKVFTPDALTRFIYSCCFQAPFPYQRNEDAIRASLYRRLMIRDLMVFSGLKNTEIALPLYTRWDSQSNAFVLGSEFVNGRPIVPALSDEFSIRRFILNGIVRPVSRIFGIKRQKIEKQKSELSELRKIMRDVERLLRRAGLPVRRSPIPVAWRLRRDPAGGDPSRTAVLVGTGCRRGGHGHRGRGADRVPQLPPPGRVPAAGRGHGLAAGNHRPLPAGMSHLSFELICV